MSLAAFTSLKQKKRNIFSAFPPNLLDLWDAFSALSLGLTPFAAGGSLCPPAPCEAEPEFWRNVWISDIVNEEFKLVLITKQMVSHS